MTSQNAHEIDRQNLRRLLLFLEEYDALNASWENAEQFLEYLKRIARLSFKTINRTKLERLYEAYRERQD